MANLKYILLSIISLTLFACGSGGKKEFRYSGPGVTAQSSNNKIINGVEIAPEASPQILKIQFLYPNGESGICSGTVIGDDDILTAAHCFAGGVSAASVTKPDGSVVAINTVYLHPGYTVNQEVAALFNDVAIARTSEPLGLPTLGIIASQAVSMGEPIGIYGYGLDENGSFGTLRSGQMLIQNISENHIFAVFDSLSNTCNGDSGGPATYNLFDSEGNLSAVGIVGITSSGSLEDCSEGDLSLFTNLQNPQILSFIAEIVPEVAVF